MGHQSPRGGQGVEILAARCLNEWVAPTANNLLDGSQLRRGLEGIRLVGIELHPGLHQRASMFDRLPFCLTAPLHKQDNLFGAVNGDGGGTSHSTHELASVALSHPDSRLEPDVTGCMC